MKKLWFTYKFWVLYVFCVLSFGVLSLEVCRAQTAGIKWPERFSGSIGFEVDKNKDSGIIVAVVDSTSEAFRKGIRPGLEIIGWNRLPVNVALGKIKPKRYRKYFGEIPDEKNRLLLLTRGRPGETAEVFILTNTGNNRGIKLIFR